MSTTITIRYQGVPHPVHPERAIPASAPTVITIPQDLPTPVMTHCGDCGLVAASIDVWTGPDGCGVSAVYSPQFGLRVTREVDGYPRDALPGEVPEWTAQMPAVHAAMVAALAEAEHTRPDVKRSCEANREQMRSTQDVDLAMGSVWLDSETGEYYALPPGAD